MIHRIFLSLILIVANIKCNASTILMSGIKYKNFSTSMLEKPKVEGKSSKIIIGEYISPTEITFCLSNYTQYISNSLCIYIYIKKDNVTRNVLLNIDTDNNFCIERNISSSGLWYCFEPNDNIIHYIKDINNLTMQINTDAKVDISYPPFIEYYTNIINYDDKRNKRSYSFCSTVEQYLDLKYLNMDDAIIAPRGITFKYCRGHCDVSNTKEFYSSSLYGILAMKFISLRAIDINNFRRCCSPESMESISILYMDPRGDIRKGELVDSTINKCVCK